MYCSTDIVRVIKSRRMGWAGHVARMGRGVYRALVGKPEGKRPLAGRWPATPWVHYTTNCNTQSSAPEDGQNNCLKHVGTGIINKSLLLHLVGCLYYSYQ